LLAAVVKLALSSEALDIGSKLFAALLVQLGNSEQHIIGKKQGEIKCETHGISEEQMTSNTNLHLHVASTGSDGFALLKSTVRIPKGWRKPKPQRLSNSAPYFERLHTNMYFFFL